MRFNRSITVILISILHICCTSIIVKAQNNPLSPNDSIKNIQLISDARIETLSFLLRNNKNKNSALAFDKTKGNARGSIYSTHGYRIIIYSGTDRNKANKVKLDFMRQYPNIRVYTSYKVPQYKIKVGNYETRDAAMHFYRILSKEYSPCMVVPDIVQINTFQKNDF